MDSHKRKRTVQRRINSHDLNPTSSKLLGLRGTTMPYVIKSPADDANSFKAMTCGDVLNAARTTASTSSSLEELKQYRAILRNQLTVCEAGRVSAPPGVLATTSQSVGALTMTARPSGTQAVTTNHKIFSGNTAVQSEDAAATSDKDNNSGTETACYESEIANMSEICAEEAVLPVIKVQIKVQYRNADVVTSEHDNRNNNNARHLDSDVELSSHNVLRHKQMKSDTANDAANSQLVTRSSRSVLWRISSIKIIALRYFSKPPLVIILLINKAN